MFKRMFSAVLVLTVLFTVFMGNALIVFSLGQLDQSKLSQGIVEYTLDQGSGKYKLGVTKSGATYYYDIAPGATVSCALQSGNGQYSIVLYRNVSGNQYQKVDTKSVTLNLAESNKNSAFLGSVQNIKWSANDAPIKKAAELTKGKKSDMDKIKAIYNYVVSNVSYDYDKAANVPKGYIPSISSTYSSKKGICYDYSSLLAAMLRSVGIPTKLVMGTGKATGSVYHAWNQVYDSASKKWITIDTTVDAVYKKSGKKTSMAKSSSDYKASKTY